MAPPEELNIQKEADAGLDSSTTSETTPSDLAVVVDELLNQLSTKFSNISTELIGKMDDMSRRLDTLEATIQSNAGGADKEETM
ncbi:heat shock factor binding protein 1-domain-containing protein [Delphinella strobiligena]|nr:heat shock factor binding protein 1-domain-containing protein [Delphinella strobiligena]